MIVVKYIFFIWEWDVDVKIKKFWKVYLIDL